MTALQFQFQTDSVTLYHKNQSIGTIHFKENPYHNQNIYLNFQLKQYDISLAPSLFQAILQHTKRPLQVMLDSADQTLIAFLEAGGFTCLRKCYEMEVSVQDYLGNPAPIQFQMAEQTENIYYRCCNLLLNHYQERHKAISPFTGEKDEFFKELPSTVYYHIEKDDITCLAFLDGNEIAYLWGKSTDCLQPFLNQLIPYLFQQYSSITFEADDVDPCAMTLKSLFTDVTDEHWDTYILR
ncbi:GNAT family acetyltransferase [Streptococcus sp. zg-86]|uniref:GNAT family acetyltransferase n=1 Tax=Streptococcus zhangguiae TaxID=2664091 RepID=A0A6I4RCC0_9STRE|nr:MULTISPECIES: GNAT family acetyltransferase [unclassified Streptococcus]MTB63602.1 GNAT family acetyltransferase [Streptococcus sp. zg-86]MTB89749.1 GNAT family acetyltransferase [Streptococcus sp. zg-36]MWV55420.1 GNAT family acetyltransferase [Streptococcus sp. zg-70]QTH47616.1 GNAT family acetyltransferase [Streptococcus sp. zg-86]